VVIVEKIDGENADVVYAWGDAPNWNVKRAYRRYNATLTPGKPELKFKGGSVEVVISMNSDLSSIQVQRTANTGTAIETFRRVASDEIAKRAAR
jgi:hypothetical protein